MFSTFSRSRARVQIENLSNFTHRPDVPVPEPLEPILLEEKKGKKSKWRRRSPSPVEWSLKGDDEDEVEEMAGNSNEGVGDLMQVDGGQDDDDDDVEDDSEDDSGTVCLKDCSVGYGYGRFINAEN